MKLELNLLPPPGFSSDDYWDYVGDRDNEAILFFPALWEPVYDSEFRSYYYGTVQRGVEEIQKSGKVSVSGKDVTLTLTRVNPSSVHLRGDYRYESDKLADVLLNTKYDLVPPVVGVSGAGKHLQDGHHRWRAYLQAGIAPLVLEVEVTPMNLNFIRNGE